MSGTVKLACATPSSAWARTLACESAAASGPAAARTGAERPREPRAEVVGQEPDAAGALATGTPLKVSRTDDPGSALQTVACTIVPGPPSLRSRLSVRGLKGGPLPGFDVGGPPGCPLPGFDVGGPPPFFVVVVLPGVVEGEVVVEQ